MKMKGVRMVKSTYILLVLLVVMLSVAIVSSIIIIEPISHVGITTTSGPIKHVIVIVLENAAYRSAYGSSSAPYLTSIGNKYALLTNYHGIGHPSLPNYIAMIAGSNFGISDDYPPLTHASIASIKEITSLMESKGITWKAYFESMSLVCNDKSSGLYAVKHNP